MNTHDSTLARGNESISSDQVDGTAVYGSDREKIGTVTNMLISKSEGRVTDVIISVGGFLGIGSELHSLPWSKLSYETELGGYLVNVTADQLKDAPSFSDSDRDRATNPEYQTSVYDYWAVKPYW
ncbi:PRC-barrel domain-containing protein [Blastomonas aquatica]|uniref:Photosystem reaction center subunit H n=1 Tax=Blastomonas aquatica TaxID=1510276 RepID=A0ABQ1IXJ9_9SPHN|nr:PRC-barrel domain-containing protein [Blastomonas aquatica]GGB54897.1 photosystem reaction center subunit H [Blastomonas aquatica]